MGLRSLLLYQVSLSFTGRVSEVDVVVLFANVIDDIDDQGVTLFSDNGIEFFIAEVRLFFLEFLLECVKSGVNLIAYFRMLLDDNVYHFQALIFGADLVVAFEGSAEAIVDAIMIFRTLAMSGAKSENVGQLGRRTS